MTPDRAHFDALLGDVSEAQGLDAELREALWSCYQVLARDERFCCHGRALVLVGELGQNEALDEALATWARQVELGALRREALLQALDTLTAYAAAWSALAAPTPSEHATMILVRAIEEVLWEAEGAPKVAGRLYQMIGEPRATLSQAAIWFTSLKASPRHGAALAETVRLLERLERRLPTEEGPDDG